MKVILLTSKVKLKDTAAAIGIFDGVHRGHLYLLGKMLAKARTHRYTSAVITFFPHPAHVLRPDLQLKYLTTMAQRMCLLEELGVDICLVVRFTKTFAHVKPESFIKNVLVRQLGVKELFVGDDFRFGRERAGDVGLFRSLSKECGYSMHGVKALKDGGKPVSSTRIRQMVAQGDLLSAKKLLGRDFSCEGKVVKGDGRGKTIGFPTANIDYQNGIMPPNGVYAVVVEHKSKFYKGVANLGFRPSFKTVSSKPLLEVHCFDLHQDLYGDLIEVSFIRKIRDERSFPSVEMLTQQINRDAVKARGILRSHRVYLSR